MKSLFGGKHTVLMMLFGQLRFFGKTAFVVAAAAMLSGAACFALKQQNDRVEVASILHDTWGMVVDVSSVKKGSAYALNVDYVYVYDNVPFSGRRQFHGGLKTNPEAINGFAPALGQVFRVRVDSGRPNKSHLDCLMLDSVTLYGFLHELNNDPYSIRQGMINHGVMQAYGVTGLALLKHKSDSRFNNAEFNSTRYEQLLSDSNYQALCDSVDVLLGDSTRSLFHIPTDEADTNHYFVLGSAEVFHSRWPSDWKLDSLMLQIALQNDPPSSERYSTGHLTPSMPLPEAFALLDTSLAWPDATEAMHQLLLHFPESWNGLIDRLGDKTKVGLTHSADLMIWSRMAMGELEFYGHGSAESEDLFTRAGRASWVLQEIATSENGRPVVPQSSAQDLRLQQAYWWWWAEAQIFASKD